MKWKKTVMIHECIGKQICFRVCLLRTNHLSPIAYLSYLFLLTYQNIEIVFCIRLDKMQNNI